MTNEQEILLKLIRGEGITTYPRHTDKRSKALYESCLELERQDLIKRHHTHKYAVVWMPI